MQKFRSIGKKATVILLSAAMLAASVFSTYAGTGGYDESSAYDESAAVALQAQAEGTVLLKNEDNALPLSKSTKVSIFGSGSVSPFLGGGGSGQIESDNPVDLYDALDEAGINYCSDLREFYDAWYEVNQYNAAYRATGEVQEADMGNVFGTSAVSLCEAPLSHLKDTDLGFTDDNLAAIMEENADYTVPEGITGQDVWQKAADYADTAIVVISRSGSESADLTATDLQLSDTEKEMISEISNEYDSVIVLFNIFNVMEMGWLDDLTQIGGTGEVDAAMIIWGPGEVGMTSVANILTGEVSPSGKLADTIAYEVSSNPTTENFGDYGYTVDGAEPVYEYQLVENQFGNDYYANVLTNGTGNTFLQYEEGIYVGYRYYSTFNKTDEVQYPFGYGLSYTDFSWDIGTVVDKGDTLSVDVKVTNTGNTAGKDVVQVYYTAPYTDGGIEKSSMVLGGYTKTSELAAGTSETVTVTLDKYYMSSYDTANSRYILEEGNYQLHVSTDAQTSLSTQNITLSEIVYDEDPTTGTTIENQFEDALGGITTLSRESGQYDVTYPTAPAWNSDGGDFKEIDIISTMDSFPEAQTEGTAFEFSEEAVAEDVMTLADVYADALLKVGITSLEDATDDQIAEFEDIYYNSDLWDEFLSQLTVDEAIDMIANCGYQTAGVDRLGIPRTEDNDGPQQIKGAGGFSPVSTGMAFPTATAIACTWNDELAEAWGVCVGNDAEVQGTNVWYAPGNNLHRSPMGGRNFEYFSEDALLSGKMTAAVTRGAQSKGLVVTLKHFALNDCETNRTGVLTWANEQSIRELYLKTFEIGVKEGNAKGIMTAFNRIGTDGAYAHTGLLTNVLRGEWGYKGFIVTDYYVYFGSGNYHHPALTVYAGNDSFLSGMYVYQQYIVPGVMKSFLESDPIGFSNAMASALKNLCYMKSFTLAFDAPEVEINTLTGTQAIVVEGFDWGAGVTKVVLSLDNEVNGSEINANTFSVTENKQSMDWSSFQQYVASTERTVVDAYISDANGTASNASASKYVTIELSCANGEGSAFYYDLLGTTFNNWCDPYENVITLNESIGSYNMLNINSTPTNRILPQADKFDRTGTFSYSDSTYGNIDLTYASYAPENDGKTNPLVIWLHGAGEGGTDPVVSLLGNRVTGLIDDDVQEIFDGSYVLVPQCQTMWMDNGTGAYTSDGTSMYTEALMALIEEYVANNPDVDPQRIYIGGCSNGGYMTMNMILNYPDYFAAAYPSAEAYSSSWITDEQIETIKDIPIWFTHAQNDPTVNIESTTIATYDRLIAAGAANVHKSIYENVIDSEGNEQNGHWSWIYVLNNQCHCDEENCKYAGLSIMEWMALQVNENVTPPTPVDKSKLQALVAEAENLNEEDYTSESWANFAAVLAEAQALLANDNATQAEVDNMITALQNAMDALAKSTSSIAPSEDPVPSASSSEDPSSTQSGTSSSDVDSTSQSSNAGKGDSAQTGDNGYLVMAIAIASVAVLSLVIIKRKKYM